MTRILQIRRGTSAQNDNFTGMNGEITMDTTNKTVRIHDGETLGGFALARADEVNTAHEVESFDITTVPATFWQSLFTTYQTTTIQSKSCELRSLGANIASYIEPFEDVSETPLFARAFLVCQSDEAGYVTGDETSAFGIGDYTYPLIRTYIEDYIAHACLFVGGQTFWVPNKTSGEKTNITNSKWKLKITVYY